MPNLNPQNPIQNPPPNLGQQNPPPQGPAAQNPPPGALDNQVLIDILRQMQVANQNVLGRANQGYTRPKAINCRSFRLGDNWTNFSTHFVENIRASYGFDPVTHQDELERECLSWLPSKLDPGPTLNAYQNIPDPEKASWTRLNAALTAAFADDAERERFLASTSSFKRGSQTLLEYRTELIRLMMTYLPRLRQVPEEWDRQIVSRFIEGLEDNSLKAELRRHCKRLKCNLQEAYDFVVDFESAQVQTQIQEGEATPLVPAKKTLAVLVNPAHSTIQPASNGSSAQAAAHKEFRQLQKDVEGLVAKQKHSEMRIMEVTATSNNTKDRVDVVSKEVNQVSEDVHSGKGGKQWN